MAPTEILAIQHFESLTEMLAPLDLNVQLLTGSTKKKNTDSYFNSFWFSVFNITSAVNSWSDISGFCIYTLGMAGGNLFSIVVYVIQSQKH